MTLTRKSGKRNGSGTPVLCNEEQIAVFRHGTDVYAVKDKCPHAGGPLHLGDIEDSPSGLCVRCPWHRWRFRIDTGDTVFPQGHGTQAVVYPVRVAADESLWIGFDKFSDSYFNLETHF
ncbi:Rieske domain-containing protein-like [Gigantopelta aegis]|uniref:Rieske domain-containing protein-like n=1 Tax=Gigantopelta aegis TaxID=1735272 RepID=UPI001B888C72|nr:Rieske domain-containing protein-like [Gigantopelta aegis]